MSDSRFWWVVGVKGKMSMLEDNKALSKKLQVVYLDLEFLMIVVKESSVGRLTNGDDGFSRISPSETKHFFNQIDLVGRLRDTAAMKLNSSGGGQVVESILS